VLTLRDVKASDPILNSAALFAQTVDEARLMAAAEIVGIAQTLFDDTLNYVKTREQFGQPLGRFQVIQHRMVDSYAKLEQIRSALYRALLQPDAHPAGVKAYIAEEAIWIAEQSVQLHGGMGMSDELGIGHGLKRIMLLSKLFGDGREGYAAFAMAPGEIG
jgi:alkylation response protein AidB-like acyl-CoA dehydrogenase